MNSDDFADVIADLKQFITATVSQQTATLKTEIAADTERIIDEKVGAMIADAKQEILEAVGDSMTTHSEVIDEQIADLDTRVTRLEQRAA